MNTKTNQKESVEFLRNEWKLQLYKVTERESEILKECEKTYPDYGDMVTRKNATWDAMNQLEMLVEGH